MKVLKTLIRRAKDAGMLTVDKIFSSGYVYNYLKGRICSVCDRVKIPRVNLKIFWNEFDTGMPAGTDGRTIIINAASSIFQGATPDDIVGRFKAILGVLCHELGHILFTSYTATLNRQNALEEGKFWPAKPDIPTDLQHNFDILEEIMKKKSARRVIQNIDKRLSNILEDGRIEKLLLAVLRNARSLTEGLIHLRGNHQRSLPTMDEILEAVNGGNIRRFEALYDLMILQYAKFGEIKGLEPRHESEELVKMFRKVQPFVDKYMEATTGIACCDALNQILVVTAEDIKAYWEEVRDSMIAAKEAAKDGQLPPLGDGTPPNPNDFAVAPNSPDNESGYTEDELPPETYTEDDFDDDEIDKDDPTGGNDNQNQQSEGEEAETEAEASSGSKGADTENDGTKQPDTETSPSESDGNSEASEAAPSNEGDTGSESEASSNDAATDEAEETADSGNSANDEAAETETSNGQQGASGNVSPTVSDEEVAREIEKAFGEMDELSTDNSQNAPKDGSDDRSIEDVLRALEQEFGGAEELREAFDNALRESEEVSEGTSPAAIDIESLFNKCAEEAAEQLQENDLLKEYNDILNHADLSKVHKNVSTHVARPPITEGCKEAYKLAEPRIKQEARRMTKKTKFKLQDDKLPQTKKYYGTKMSDPCDPYNRMFSKQAREKARKGVTAAIMIDQSGSMGGDRIEYARLAACIFYEFCVQSGINCNIYGHETRGIGVHIDVYVDSRKPSKDDKYRLMNISAGGCNRDGLPIRMALERLEKTAPEDEKLMFVISDGSPNDNNYYGSVAEQDLKDIAKTCEKKRIALICAAIGDDKENIRHCYGDNHFLDISNLDKLPMAMGNLVKSLLK